MTQRGVGRRLPRQLLPEADLNQVLAALDRLSHKFRDLLDAVTDADWGRTVAGMTEWTVADLVRHVTLLPEYYGEVPDGVPRQRAETPAAMASINATNLQTVAVRDRAACLAAFDANLPALFDQLRNSPYPPGLPFHAGLLVPPAALGSMAIGEWCLHGQDLARTLRRPWTIESNDALLVLQGFESIAPAWVDPSAARGHTADYEIRLRGTPFFVRWRFEDGQLDVAPDEPFRPDTIVWAQPTAMLSVFYGRQSQWAAAAKGAMVAGGRRPWHALRLTSKFHPA